MKGNAATRMKARHALILLFTVMLVAASICGAFIASAGAGRAGAGPQAEGDGVHRGGCLPTDPAGFEQAPILDGGAPLAASVDLSSQIPPIGNQGSQNSCVGWTTSYYYKSWSEKKKHPSNDLSDPSCQFSPSFVYNQINGGVDNGATFGDAFRLLETKGDVSIKSMPYYEWDFTTQPTSAQLKEALKYRIPSDWRYLWCNDRGSQPYSNNIGQVKSWLASGKMLAMAMPLYRDLPNYWGNPPSPYYDYNGYSSRTGAHAVSIVGYNDNINPGGADADHRGGFLMANSWGPGWNGPSRGYVYLSYNFVKKYMYEAWVMNDTQTGGATEWYLPEGTTAWGFICSIGVMNPNRSEVIIQVTYNTDRGAVDGGKYRLPAMTAGYIYPSDTLGEKDFSTRIVCLSGKPIAVDRNMFFTPSAGGQGAGARAAGLERIGERPDGVSPDLFPTAGRTGGKRWSSDFEGHASVGVNAPANKWYLPEGSSRWGFTTWLLIQNPNRTAANCNVTYMTQDSKPKRVNYKIPAGTRKTFNMAAYIGEQDSSISISSDVPVIPERAMYRNQRSEGHDSIGTTAPAYDYYLAEGTTAWGFLNYVLVQNPNNAATTVDITYMTPNGPVSQPSFRMAPNSRTTIRVNDISSVSSIDLSTRVHGSRPIIAERAMYWIGGELYKREACHDSIGMAEPHTSFYLPSGDTGQEYNAETYTLVQNLNKSAVKVRVTYVAYKSSNNRSFEATIGAQSRRTFNMADTMPPGNYGIIVESLSPGKKIMVERAMYWISRGAGADTIGAFGD